MRIRISSALRTLPLALALLVAATLAAQTMPPLKRQPTPAKVVEAHMAAFSNCDWTRLMEQFPDNVEFFGPNGQVIRGKAALGAMFAQVVKPPSQGGTCGLKVVAEHTFVVGDVIFFGPLGGCGRWAHPAVRAMEASGFPARCRAANSQYLRQVRASHG